MKKIVSFILVSLIPLLSFAQNFTFAHDAIPSHCLPDEKVLLSGAMGTGNFDNFKPNGKVLSICADSQKEPINRIVYRFGRVGSVEMEHVSTPQLKMNLSSGEQIRTKIGIFWFKKGDFTYAVSEYSGVSDALDLQVFKGDKRLVRLNAKAREFEANTESINFDKPKSPALIAKPIPVFLEL